MNVSATTVAQIDARVQAMLDSYTESWKRASAEFADHFSTNPEYAIEWDSARVIEAQAKHVVAIEIADRPDGMTLAEAVARQIVDLERQIRRDGGRSTSPYANANFHAAREAKVEVLERLEDIAASYAKVEAV